MKQLATVAAVLALVLAAAPATPSENPKAQAGAYCPFPKPGETPQCFDEVQSEYSDFFAAVESGEADREDLEQVAADLEGPDDAGLAVSSLAYAYYRYAERAAAAPEPDPALVAQLEGINDLLAGVYADSGETPAVRTAVRDAARDLHERAPAVEVGCKAGENCGSTDSLLERIALLDDPTRIDTGVRGRLYRVYERVFGASEPEASE